MRTIRPHPIPGLPLLYVPGKSGMLVASDIHVGLFREEGHTTTLEVGSPASLAEILLTGARRTKAKRVLLLGDVKEPILGAPWHVRKEIRDFFFRLQAADLKVEICTGNHDVGLERMVPPDVAFHPSTGLLRGGVGYFHGHAWPSPIIRKRARFLVAGHLHPGLRLATRKMRCWVRVDGDPEVIVVPTLNPLCANESLNRERPKRTRRFLVNRFLSQGEARAYLLDGTDMGKLDFNLNSPL